MNKTIFVYAGILVLSLGAAWQRYTGDEKEIKEGVVLVEGKAAELEKVVYTSPELTVTFEMKTDALGRYGWAKVEDRKKKGKDDTEPVTPKVTEFKTGSAADKLVEAFSPFLALRGLENVTDEQLNSFGLKTPDTTLTVSIGGKTSTFDLGGETYGTKDRYARNQADGKIYVIDDEPFKTLKFAGTRLPERGLMAAKVEQIDSVTMGVGATNVAFTQKNKDDKTAAYWEREGGTGKDETFGNWIDKVLKLKSTGYVQEADKPADLTPGFDLTVRSGAVPTETVHVLQSGEDWYAQSESTRGLVKLSRGAAKDAVDDADDVAAGKAPPEKPKPPAPPKPTPGGPPGMAAGGPPGAPPGMMPPGHPMPGGPGGPAGNGVTGGKPKITPKEK